MRVRQGAGADPQEALRKALAFVHALLTAPDAGWKPIATRPLRHVSFELPPALIAAFLTDGSPIAGAALRPGPGGAPPPLHLDLVPVLAPRGDDAAATWQQRHAALLGGLLARGPQLDGAYPEDDMRTLQVRAWRMRHGLCARRRMHYPACSLPACMQPSMN